MLLAAGICSSAGDGGGQRGFRDFAAVAAGDIRGAARSRFLAAADGQPVCGEAELFERGIAVVGARVRGGNDFVSAGDCRLPGGSICGVREVKAQPVALGLLVAAVIAGAAYLGVGSTVPPGQDPLATLTQTNFAGGVRADPAYGLARNKLEYSPANSRHSGETVLGSESSCGVRTQSDRE